MRKTTTLMMTIALLTWGSACGGDDDAADAGFSIRCPRNAPDVDGMQGSCCWRVSNADRRDSPELRMAAFQISEPLSLANGLVNGVLANALDSELFNWLLQFEITGSDVSITTGYGIRSCVPMGPESCMGDSTFRFDIGGDYPPVTMTGSIDGEVVSAPRLEGAFTVPIFAQDGVTVQLTLPLNNFEVGSATFTDDRSCVGRRRGPGFVTDGDVSAFMTVDSARMGRITVGATLDTTLCMLVAGNETSTGLTCGDVPRADWTYPPDALCSGMPVSCTQDPGDGSICDPLTDCNAWFVRASFAAQGVDITS